MSYQGHPYDGSLYDDAEQAAWAAQLPPDSYTGQSAGAYATSVPVQPPPAKVVIIQMLDEMRREGAEARARAEAQSQATNITMSAMAAVLTGFQQFLVVVSGSVFLAPSATPAPVAPPPAPTPSAAPPLPLPLAPTPVPAQAPTPAPAAFEQPIAKFCEPRLFSGVTTELEPFLDEVNNTICMQRMVLDLDKTSYLISYLKDRNPKTWYYAIKAHSPHLLSDYHAFVAELCHSFADPNISCCHAPKVFGT
ncbi:hypothetical protein OBBRIDRAFT_840077 [Obba rivulosa]|uniref:Uncharacterized protein n=1 Tax=Obba rivulosa TaxID=1052685 RepID=A0A8E2DEQ8_9APHY|nr:hypothetical protein OBBRIDRAFT_840077 [Obba rivulosa]